MSQKIACIVPCYNEQYRLNSDDFVSFQRQNENRIDLFFSNDGSTDNTLQLLTDITERCSAKIIYTSEQNIGKAETVRQSMILLHKHYPEYDYIGFIDADLQIPLDQLKKMQKIAENDGPDIISSSRYKDKSIQSHNFTRSITSKLFVWFVNFLFNFKLTDTQCGNKLYKAWIVDQLFNEKISNKWLFDIDIFIRYAKLTPKNLRSIIELQVEKILTSEKSSLKPSDIPKTILDLLNLFVTHQHRISLISSSIFIGIIIPFLFLFITSESTLDDYIFIEYKKNGYLEAFSNWFSKENGRYFNACIMLLPFAHNWLWYKITTMCIFLILLLSIYWLSSILLKNKATQVLVTLTLTSIIILNHPSTNEGFFWLPSSSHYILGPAIMISLLCSIYKFKETNSSTYQVTSILSVFALCGSNEILSAAILSGTFAYLVVNIFNRQKLLFPIGLFFSSLIGSILSYLLLSQSRMVARQFTIDFSFTNLRIALSDAIYDIAGYGKPWILDHYYVFIALILIGFIHANNELKKTSLFHVFITFSATLIASLFVCRISYFTPRFLNLLYIVYLMGVSIISIIIGSKLSNIPKSIKILIQSNESTIYGLCIAATLLTSTNFKIYRELFYLIDYKNINLIFERKHLALQVYELSPGVHVGYDHYCKTIFYKISNKRYPNIKDLNFRCETGVAFFMDANMTYDQSIRYYNDNDYYYLTQKLSYINPKQELKSFNFSLLKNNIEQCSHLFYY